LNIREVIQNLKYGKHMVISLITFFL